MVPWSSILSDWKFWTPNVPAALSDHNASYFALYNISVAFPRFQKDVKKLESTNRFAARLILNNYLQDSKDLLYKADLESISALNELLI